jgi:hypothetical protein
VFHADLDVIDKPRSKSNGILDEALGLSRNLRGNSPSRDFVQVPTSAVISNEYNKLLTCIYEHHSYYLILVLFVRICDALNLMFLEALTKQHT